MMANMERELGLNQQYAKGKGKAKGKGLGKGGKGKGKGEGKAAGTSTSTTPSNSPTCTRCGKNNHHERDCYHREKVCDNCGKTGHVRAACRNNATTPTQSTNGDKVSATVPKPTQQWTCFTCFVSNEYPATNKCGNCKAKRITMLEDNREETETSLIDKRILKVLEGSGAEDQMDIGIDNEMDADLAGDEEVEKLKTVISTAKTLGLVSAIKEAEEKLEAINKRRNNRQPSLLTTTRLAKGVIAEKMRLLKQHEDRTKNLETKKEAAMAARVRQAEEKEKAKKREEERHAAAMARLDEEFAQAELHQTKTMENAEEDLKKVNEQYKKDILKLDEFMQNNKIAAEAPTQPSVARETEGTDKMPEKDAIMQHLVMDTNLTGKEMTPELIAESMMKLMQQQGTKRQNTEQTLEEKPPAKKIATEAAK